MDRLLLWKIWNPIKRFLYSRQVQSQPRQSLAGKFVALSPEPCSWHCGEMWGNTRSPSSPEGRKGVECTSHVLTCRWTAQRTGFSLAWIQVLTRSRSHVWSLASESDQHAPESAVSETNTRWSSSTISYFSATEATVSQRHQGELLSRERQTSSIRSLRTNPEREHPQKRFEGSPESLAGLNGE